MQNTHTGSGTQNNNNRIVNVGKILVNNFTTSRSRPYKSLWDTVSGVGASHTAKHQFARGRCLKGTRKKVLGELKDWLNDRESDCRIFWLSGTAGAGKSAIAMTVAEACEKADLLVSSFFCFRSDPNRNNPSAITPTIAHGLISTIPFMRSPIERRISKDPTILEAELEIQFRELIVKPILQRRWYRELFELLTRRDIPDVVIIDGLDECGDEETQLRILSVIQSAVEQSRRRFPLRFMICSRPESWIQEAFFAQPLKQLTRHVTLDIASSSADRDIMRYYLHEFQKISTSPKYNNIRFPSPWPSPEELRSLVDRASGQFVYAATVVKFVILAYSHPINQLQFILKNISSPQSGLSPYPELDVLYHVILSANPHQEKVLSILQAILILPSGVANPACIELLLGLTSGEVSLTLRAMHSVLDIRGRGHDIRPYHTSFREYLADPTRSRNFHIDIPAQRYVIGRKWLQDLTARKMSSYSVEQLYSDETKPFFREWFNFCCDSFSRPTRDLLQDLYNVDLASTTLCQQVRGVKPGTEHPFFTALYSPTPGGSRSGMFRRLLPWVEKYGRAGAAKTVNQAANSTRWEVDIVEAFKIKFSERPKAFHLERPPDVPLQHVIVSLAVHSAADCIAWTRPWQTPPLDGAPLLRLTDCRCDLRGREHASNHPGHSAFEEACLQVVRTCISHFQAVATERRPNFWSMTEILTTLLGSSLLRYCRLDKELLSLCRSFLESAKLCRDLKISSWEGEELRLAVLEWIGTFPKPYAKEARALEAQVIALPWRKWAQSVPATIVIQPAGF